MSVDEEKSGAADEGSAADLVAAAFSVPQAEAARRLESARAVAEAEARAEAARIAAEQQGGESGDGAVTMDEVQKDESATSEDVEVTSQVSETSESSDAAQASEDSEGSATSAEAAEAPASEAPTVALPTAAAEASAETTAEAPAEVLTPAPAAQSQDAPRLDPAAFFSMLTATTEAEAAPDAKPRRRALRLVGRYSLVLLVVGAIGAGTAYAVTLPKRTDIPTLKTKDDGRYQFPGLAKPALAAGVLAPGDAANPHHLHGADLRKYLLPAPKGATPDPAYPAAGGWVDPEKFADGFDTSTLVKTTLADDGVRRIATRAWTAADGQHTTITLVQFPDDDAAADFITEMTDVTVLGLEGAGDSPTQVTVRDVGGNGTRTVDIHEEATVTPPAIPQSASGDGLSGRFALWEIGDTVAVVTTTGPKKVTDVPTIQVIQLESEMLD